MFKKPGEFKSSTPLRNSDLRKLRLELCTTYSISTELSQLLLPDSLLVSKGKNHLDEHLTFFSIQPSKDTNIVLAFRTGKDADNRPLLPTIYMLDLWPELLKGRVQTVEPVIEKLLQGSALFSRGVQCGYQLLPTTAQQGDLVSIVTSPQSKSEAIGFLDRSRTVLIRQHALRGQKTEDADEGKAVNTLCVRGDWLWNLGGGEMYERIFLPDSAVPKLDDLTIAEKVEGVEIELEKSVVDAPPTPAEVDTILRNALLLFIFKKSIPAENLPILASTLFSLVLPCRPHYITPALADIKKSTYKKSTAFFKFASTAGLLTTKEVKGELMIMSINVQHPDVQSVRSYKTLADATKQVSAAASAEEVAKIAVQVLSYCSPSLRILQSPLFESVVTPSRSTVQSIRAVLSNYVTKQRLVHQGDGKYIILDSILKETLLLPGEDLEFMAKDLAMQRLVVGATYSHEMRVGGKEGIVHEGPVTPIKIVGTKGKGNNGRLATLVTGFESWPNVDPISFMNEVKGIACASVFMSEIGTPKLPKSQIKIQGKEEALVTSILLKRGIPRAFIDGAKDPQFPEGKQNSALFGKK